MDTIANRLIRYELLKKQVPLLEMQVNDLKLINYAKDSIITLQAQIIDNNQSTINNYEQAITEFEIILGEAETLCKYQKKQVRVRWVIITGSALIGGVAVGAIVF